MTTSRVLCALAGGFLLFAVSRGLALLTLDHSPRPRLQITPAEIDLGTVVIGQSVERTFLVRNVGSARLLITNVKSTCQCTVADLPSRVVAPGGSVPLRVTFDARATGPKLQTVTVQSNDPDVPTHILKLRAQAVVANRP